MKNRFKRFYDIHKGNELNFEETYADFGMTEYWCVSEGTQSTLSEKTKKCRFLQLLCARSAKIGRNLVKVRFQQRKILLCAWFRSQNLQTCAELPEISSLRVVIRAGFCDFGRNFRKKCWKPWFECCFGTFLDLIYRIHTHVFICKAIEKNIFFRKSKKVDP